MPVDNTSNDHNARSDSGDKQTGKAKKRLFISLIMGTSFLLCLSLLSLWLVPYIGLIAIHPAFPLVWGIVVVTAIFFVVWASFGLVLSIISGRTLPFFGRMRGVTVTLFLPLMILLGRVLGISKDRIRSSFIKVNNELVAAKNGRYAPHELLLLMPHCLQSSKCSIRLTYDINNCKRCGKCPLTGLLTLSDKYGIHLAVATGGTIARRIVVQKRPRLILAVACERDLASGIQDTYPLPVFGILNRRPHGPCLDTKVPLADLEAAVRKFLHPRHFPAASPSRASLARDAAPSSGLELSRLHR
jgi:uncharacterized protein